VRPSLSRRVPLVLLILTLGLVTAAVVSPFLRRRALVLYLHLGDLVARDGPARRLDGELLVFDAADPADRAAFARTHGDLHPTATGDGRHLVLATAPAAGEHEVCTRRVPRDWSAFAAVRLELRDASGGAAPDGQPLPVLLSLRARNRPGWSSTRWLLHRTFVAPLQRQLELDVRVAERFIDPRKVRQLCLSLTSTGQPTSLTLSRIVLTSRWSADHAPLVEEPLSLHLLGDSTKLRRFDPLPASVLAGAVTLEAARGETVAFQLVLRRGVHGPGSARVSLPPLVGPAGQRLVPQLFEEQTIVVRQGSSAMFGPGLLGPGVYPDPLVPLVDGHLDLWRGNRLVWIDLAVPSAATPGSYRTSLRVELPGRTLEREVRLEVRPVVLPPRQPLVMILYLLQLLEEATGLPRPQVLELERELHRLVHAHGAYLATTPALSNIERLVPMLDASLYGDDALAPPYWPIDLMASDRIGMQRSAQQWMRWLAARRLRVQPFAYLFDEPGSREDYQLIRRRAAWVHEAAPPGNLLPVMVTEQVTPDDPGWPSLIGAVDYWTSPLDFPEPAASRRRSTRERFFTYNGGEPGSGSQLLDADGVSLRTWGWIAFLFEIDLWLLWQGAYFRDIFNGGPRADPYVEAATFDKRHGGKAEDVGNGDGVIVYPPRRRNGPPVASLRLKVLRRGEQDRRYLLLAARCGRGAEARTIARELIPRAFNESKGAITAWPKDERPWERARLRLLRLVEGCPDATMNRDATK
jgi:hypothetical protein